MKEGGRNSQKVRAKVRGGALLLQAPRWVYALLQSLRRGSESREYRARQRSSARWRRRWLLQI